MLHLPFHLCLALTLEGLRTWTIIANVQYNFNKVYGYVDQIVGQTPDVFRLGELSPEIGSKVVSTLNKTAASFGFDKAASWNSMQAALTKMNLTWDNDPTTIGAGFPGGGPQDKNGVLKFYFEEFVSLFQNEQFISNSLVVPDIQVKAAKGSGVVQMEAYLAVFKMIFIYFFVCAAFVLIILGTFRGMSIGPTDKVDRVLILIRTGTGVFLGFLGLLALVDERVTSYINSGALLPTLLFALVSGKADLFSRFRWTAG
jgi:hypothetical protein